VDYYKTMLEATGYYAVCGAKGCIRACMMQLEKRVHRKPVHNEFRSGSRGSSRRRRGRGVAAAGGLSIDILPPLAL
jgi:hypothetical protein